jgi:hypothetical protein
MARSHAEIRRVLAALCVADPTGGVHSGSRAWLLDAATPVPSPAAEDLIARARGPAPDRRPLYLLAVGARPPTSPPPC